ncbi:MAG TPA: hypothetical protein VFM45_05400 [Anaeromyxobacteraceae bacterium]|nr:hypothetical protein [Anaeromyxobacteraceae bacterium]
MLSSRVAMGGDRPRHPGWGKGVAAWWALLLAAAPVAGRAVAPRTGLQDVPLPVLASRIIAGEGLRVSPAGLVVPVQGDRIFVVPLPGTVLAELDYRATGDLLLTWTTTTAEQAPRPLDSPWHHERLETGSGKLSLEFRTTPGWSPSRLPFFLLTGTGELVITALRVRTVGPDAGAEAASRDEAIRWAPVRHDHSTINFFFPTVWWASRGTLLFELLGPAFLAAMVLGAVAWRAVRKRWEPAPAIAVAAVAVALAGNVVFAVRARQLVSVEPRLGAADRLAANFKFGPEIGKLAALARSTVRPGERIAIQSDVADWFPWETLCFHLAPHPCVQVVPGAAAWSGLSGVDRLAPAEVDVVVYLHARTPLLPGYEPVATLAPEAFVARRR